MAKGKKEVSMEAGLWNACNKLRGSVSATDYVNVVLGLLFLRFAYDKFNAQREKLLADEETADFINNPRFYSKDNVFFLEENDRWNYIKDNSKSNKIFTYIDDAFRNMEKNNPTLKGALPIGFYITLHIEPSKFSSLIDEIDRIQYSQEESDDVIGRVYEYFLRKFCIAAKSEKGEFYTPGNIVELMTLLIQPYSGSVYDPCCGSGGMFVQSAEFIKRHKGNKKDITIYGQESNDKTYKLARMNLAIRGLNCDLGDMDASTFTSDKHPNLRADFILANPPYQLSDDGGGAEKSAAPLYHKFVEQAKKLKPRYLSMIIPSRWFNGGKGLDDFRSSMLKDTCVSHIVDCADSKDCFPGGVDIPGGICYFLWEREYSGQCSVTNIMKGGEQITADRVLDEYPTVIRNNNAVSVVHKVVSKYEQMFNKIVSSRKPFGLE